MSPQGLLVAPPSPQWPIDLSFPYGRRTVGQAINTDEVGGVPNHSGQTTYDTDAGTGGSAGSAFDYQPRSGTFSAHLQVLGGAVQRQVGFNFPWWTPHWSDADLAPGAVSPELSRVAIFDIWLSLAFTLANPLQASSSGVWFTAFGGSAFVGLGNTPDGGSPFTPFGIEWFQDVGVTRLRYAAYDGLGTLVDSAVPSTPVTPADWNRCRVVIIGAAPGRPAQLNEVTINGDRVVNGQDFGAAAPLLRPDVIRSGAGATMAMQFVAKQANGTVDQWFRWRARFGTFRPDGAEVLT